jgi:DNA-binding response OmpR family regulator
MSKGAILIVEDEKDISDILEEMLILFGYKTAAISDGLDAWRLLSSKEYDLILTDLRLPGIDGIELLTRMRLNGMKTPVLIISGIDLRGHRAALAKLEQCDTIQKPFRMDELQGKIARLINSSKQREPKAKHKHN